MSDAEEIKRLKSLLDRDRTGMATALAEIRRVVGGWGWIPDGSWGCYEWHERSEEALRGEVGQCFDKVEEIAKTALEESGTRAVAAYRPDRCKVEILRSAIGVCVPSIIRCFRDGSTSDVDVELAGKVLLRVEKAMKATE